jgi:serine/threonine protein kinase
MSCLACFEGDVENCEHDGRSLRLSLPVARTIDQKYRLDRLVGKGGMGAVYEARDLRLDRPVAVKIMLSRAFGEQAALRRFRREARAAAQLDHPNIVRVFDFGPLEGEGAYLVMEMVRGRTLRAELDRLGRLPPEIAAEWFGPLLDGTAAAHAHGIIHRDLKPENVIGRRDESGSLVVKILDLGLVKFRAGEPLATGPMTADGLVMGTPAYMSPEQLLGREVDQRTDIFALTVMLIESLTGRRPFDGDTLADLLLAQQQTSYRLPGSSTQARSMDDLLQQCLARDPRNRVSSATTLRDTLIPLLRAWPADDVAVS